MNETEEKYMNSKSFAYHDEIKRDTYEKLKEEYDSIQKDIYTIKNMEITEEAKKLPLEELESQKNEVKERMHNYIDTL